MSTLVAQTISNGTVSTSSANVIQGSAKAWVNFNGSGGATIRGSYNVSSVTRNSTGLYTINFTNAFVDTNYAVNVTAGNPFNSVAGEMIGLVQAPNSTTSVQVRNATTGASYDTSIACVSCFR